MNPKRYQPPPKSHKILDLFSSLKNVDLSIEITDVIIKSHLLSRGFFGFNVISCLIKQGVIIFINVQTIM